MKGFARTLLALGALSMPVLVTGCGSTEYQVRGSDRAAGADALIQVEDFEGARHQVRVSFSNLPPADRIGTGNTTFIVWSISRNQSPRNEGPVDYDPDARTGVAVFVTAEQALTVRVTAERNATVNTPSDQTIIQRAINSDD